MLAHTFSSLTYIFMTTWLKLSALLVVPRMSMVSYFHEYELIIISVCSMKFINSVLRTCSKVLHFPLLLHLLEVH